jgi:hypothetical protein
MQYLSIKYNISGLQTQDIKKIEAILSPFEKEYFNKYKLLFPNYTIPNLDVVLSENIWSDVEQFYLENERKLDELRPKGLEHLVKIVTLDDRTKYFWNSRYFDNTSIKNFFNVLIGDLISTHLEKKYGIDKQIQLNLGISRLSEILFKNWLVLVSSKKLASEITKTTELEYDSMEDFTFAFKRNIKQLHYAYQREIDNYKFLMNCILELDIYVRRVLSYKTSQNFTGLEEFDDEMKGLTAAIDNSNFDLENIGSKEYNIAKESIINIFKKCDIEIYDNTDLKGMGFHISHGPKKLFPDLIDTHPRIICFIDILGFKALIDEYESQNTSLVLKKLKQAFDTARQIAFNLLVDILSDDFKDEIEIRMFSDCITISLPFIEFGTDIKNGFYNMAIILNVFQQTFMKDGFYLRGHLTIGSYYSDDNMLFSGGLVEAYLNESCTVYPVVSINSKVIDKIKKKTEYDDSLPSFNKLIICHNIGNVEHNKVLNPFFTFESYKNIDEQFNKIFDRILGTGLSELGIDFSFKKILEKEFSRQGIGDMDSEIEKGKNKIIEVLIEKYKEQLNIYQNMNYSHNKRLIASQIIEKYKFLFALFRWLSDENDTNFEYLEI